MYRKPFLDGIPDTSLTAVRCSHLTLKRPLCLCSGETRLQAKEIQGHIAHASHASSHRQFLLCLFLSLVPTCNKQENIRMMCYSVMTQANSEKEIPSAPIRSRT